jgi:hypothetical protein
MGRRTEGGLVVGKVMIIVGGIFAPVGAILLVVCAALTINTVQFRASAVSTTGTVVDVRPRLNCSDGSCTTTYRPVVAYRTPDGAKIIFTSDSGTNSRPQVGSRVTVLFAENDPGHARLDSFTEFWLAPLITGLLGIVFTGIGAVLIITRLRRRSRDAWLDTHGTRISAEIVRVEQNRSVRINGVHPWRVIADWVDPASGGHATFTSGDLRHNPSDRITGRRTIEVLIDPADPGRRYRMLLESVGVIG